MENITWTYKFPDNYTLVVFELDDRFVLEEYDSYGNPVVYTYRKGNKFIKFDKVRYNKKGYTLSKVIEDIEEDYGQGVINVGVN